MKMISLKKQKHGYLVHTWSDKAFMGTVVNRTLSSLHGVSLEITLTVSLSRRIYWPLRGDGERNKRIEISPNVPS